MSEKRTIPHFCSEAEEAQWWFDNQDRIDADFEAALADGTLGRGTAMKRALLFQDGVLPEPGDVERARTLAEKRGMPYQDFIKQLIHTQLELEAAIQMEHAEAA